jgi:hypothetical protein
MHDDDSTDKSAAVPLTLESIREECQRRNSGNVAQGYAWGVVIPLLLAEIKRLLGN